MEEKSEKEKRIRAIVKMYYSNPKVQEVLVKFAQNRETVPRYFEGFGKRPDMIQYPSDIMGLVSKGATSFHSSEELWNNPLDINNEMSPEQFDNLRRGWDLLIDIDSPYLDLSKIAAKLVIRALEFHGINHYGIKFSVSGDTPVLIRYNNKTGLVPIKKAIDLFKSGKKIEILSMDKDKKLTYSRVYDSLVHNDLIYEIKHEQSKIPLKTTAHHSVFVFDKGKIYEKKTSELKAGDYLVTFNSNANGLINREPKRITNKFLLNGAEYENKIEINKGLMRLLGYYLAEGHVTSTINQVGFSFNIRENEYIMDCINLLKEITKKNISVRHPNKGSTQILIHSKEWSTFFEEICGKSKNKHVPPFAWNISKELFLEMLRGYIREDGYKLGKYYLATKSVALQLVKELVWLCKLNGISCSLSSEKNKPHRLPQGTLFKGSFVYILKMNKSEIGIKEFDRKRNKFSPYPRDRTFPIDGLKIVYKRIRPSLFNEHRPEQMTLSKKRANLERIKKVILWFKKFKTRNFDKECLDIIKGYESLFSSDAGVVQIKSIKKCKKDKVYDVSVEKSEAFFGGDYPILLHNSGSKGFHIIVGWNAFPKEFEGKKTKDMFPEWPRAITEYLFKWIEPIFMKEAGKIMSFGKSENDKVEVHCTQCGRLALGGTIVKYHCPTCDMLADRKNVTMKKKIKCMNPGCAGVLEIVEEKQYSYCELCKDPDNEKISLDSIRHPESFEEKRGEKISEHAKFDLVLVAPRHLFRMPYSLHEKTALASIVINKDQIENFVPRDANALSVKPVEFYPENTENEAARLLKTSIEWKRQIEKQQEEVDKNFYGNYKTASGDSGEREYEEINAKDIRDEMFPESIKKLLKGLKDGRKRGLFILITFFRSLNYTPEEINNRIREWNKLNPVPLKEGYVKSQIDWHLKQKRKILPPNYENDAFYKDLGIIDKRPDAKNPLVELKRNMKKGR